ncbi:MAG: isochorismatase family protein [Desulforhopalus sp.]
MRNRLLAPKNVCLQIIDVQQSLMSKITGADRVTATVDFMIQCAKILEIPIVANTQYKKGLGPYVPAVESLVGDVTQIDKSEFNAIANKETEAFINGLPKERDTLILVGVETHICIYQTAVGLLMKGLDVWVVTDGVSSRKLQDHQTGLQRLQHLGVSLGSSEMLIYELLGKAGSPEFKKILPLIVARNE